MKKIALLTILVTFSFTLVFSQKGYINPAANYAQYMGYDYSIVTDVLGNQTGEVTLPNGEKVDAWDFYKGKVANEYQYGARYGFDTETEIIKHPDFIEERAICVTMEKGEEIRIPLLELMSLNNEPLINENDNDEDSYRPETYDPNFEVNKSLPTAFDWRNVDGKAYIDGVRNQGSCGSCYAFGATAAAEGTFNYATNSYDGNCADFSESWIAFCLGSMSPYSSHFGGCNGADYDYMELQALCDIGHIDESFFPYTDASNQDCPSSTDAAPKILYENWYRVPSTDVDAIKTAIMTYGVVDAAVYVTTSFQNYTGGVWSDSNSGCSNGAYTTTNHAIALVGWGYDATYGDYWILRNSWGPSWGEDGYMRIAVNSAAVDCAVCYMVYDNSPKPPVANFSADATTILPGTTIDFTDNSLYDPTSWSWTFEGGTPSTSTAQNPSVKYNELGIYTVTLTVTNDLGTDTETKTAYINVVDEIIDYCSSSGNSTYEWIANVEVGDFSNASGAGGYQDFTGLTANLAAGQTYDISLTPDFSGRSYYEYWKIWIDLNRDGDFDDVNENVFDAGSLSKRTVSGSITIPAGTSTATTRMRVSMKYEGEQTACETFGYGEVEDYTVNIVGNEPNLPPVAEANGPYSGDEGAAISFSSAGSDDPDGNLASYYWEFGDGGTSTAANPSHTYTTNGTYTATLTVTDDDGATDSDQATVTVNDIPNVAPVADANGPYSAYENDAINFSSNGSYDSDGNISSYYWEFGDGGTSTAANPTHTYTAPGTYTATLTVTDNEGATDSDQATVTITTAPVNQAPVADANGPYSAEEGTAINFSSAGSYDPDGTIVSYYWEFGDGGTSTASNPSHTYTTNGTYTATLTVTDDDGATDSDQATVTITEMQEDAIMSSEISIYTYQQGPFYKANANITITSEGQPVSEALVEGYWSGSVSSSASGLTAADGTITFNVKTKSGDSFTFTITSVSKTGYIWDGLNNSASNGGKSATGLSEMGNNVNEVSIYPNPAINNISVSFAGYENAQLEIYDMAGNQVRNITMDRSKMELDISNLQNGMYFIIINDGQEMISKRFIKN